MAIWASQKPGRAHLLDYILVPSVIYWHIVVSVVANSICGGYPPQCKEYTPYSSHCILLEFELRSLTTTLGLQVADLGCKGPVRLGVMAWACPASFAREVMRHQKASSCETCSANVSTHVLCTDLCLLLCTQQWRTCFALLLLQRFCGTALS